MMVGLNGSRHEAAFLCLTLLCFGLKTRLSIGGLAWSGEWLQTTF